MEKRIKEKLREVCDPELGMSILDLGLVYGIECSDSSVKITMTMTSPMCPYWPVIEREVKETVGGLLKDKKVEVELVWDPPWSPARMSEAARLKLGIPRTRGDAK